MHRLGVYHFSQCRYRQIKIKEGNVKMKKTKLYFGLAIMLVVLMLGTACAPAVAPTEAAAAPTEAAAAPTEVAAAPTEAAAAPTEAAAEPAKEPVSVFMSVGMGGLGDGGYNDGANAGALQAEKELGIKLQVYEPKSLSEIEAQMLAAAESKEYDLILGIGMDNASGIDKASDAYPDQAFAIYQAVYDKPNVLSANQALEDGAFQIGVLVATLYKENLLPGVPEGTHKMGYVLAMSGGEINKQIFALEAGGKSVDPDFEVVQTEVGGWTDQAKAKELAVALFEKGCGVVWHYAGNAGHGIFEAAKETGGYVIGAHGNQNDLADTVIVSRNEDMTASIFSTIKSYVDGSFTSGSVRFGLKDNVVNLTYEGSKVEIPDSVKAQVDEVGKKIISGEIKPPTSQEELDAYLATLK
jgi:basic membrane protein A